MFGFYALPRFLAFLLAPLALGLDDGGGGGGGGAGSGAAGAGGAGDGSGGAGAGAGGGSGGGAGGGGAGSGQGGGAGGAPVTDVRTFIDDKGNIVAADKFFAGDTAHLSKRFTSLGALAKSYVSLERQLSNPNKVAMPGENSTPEEWDAFYAKLGRPEKPEAYDVKAPDSLKDVVLNEESMTQFKGLAFKLGLNPKQVTELSKFYFDTTAKSLESVTAQQTQVKEQAVAALKKEWAGNYDTNLALAKKAAIAVGGEELLANPTLANDPMFIRAMANVGAKLSEQSLAGGRNGSPAPQDPRAEAQRILADKKDPYWLPQHPQHAARVEHVRGLFEKANPEPAKG
jgi:hypothetical protein